MQFLNRHLTIKKLLLSSTCTLALLFAGAFPQTASAEPRERHPEIREAIHALENAVRHLKEAEHDFGGHRAQAVAASEHAIEQLRLALEADKR